MIWLQELESRAIELGATERQSVPLFVTGKYSFQVPSTDRHGALSHCLMLLDCGLCLCLTLCGAVDWR